MNTNKVGESSFSPKMEKPAKNMRLFGGKVASLTSKSHLLVKNFGMVAQTAQKAAIVGLAIGGIGFIGTGYEMYSNIKDIHHSKGRVKLIPSLLLVSNFGNIAGYCGQVAGFIVAKLQLAGTALSHASVAITALSVAAIGLQLVKLTVDVVELRTLFKMSKLFEKDMTTEVKGVRSIFRVFSKVQLERFDKIKGLYKSEPLKSLVKERFSYLKKMKALSIAIGVIAIVGVVLASFSPPPICFIGWAVIGATIVVAIAHAVHMEVNKRRFDNQLAILSGEKVSPADEAVFEKYRQQKQNERGLYGHGEYSP
jgi:hypothetical protein